ncbi:MAG: LysR family transcriptional regulator [bacterium]|nr:LysR family transcriptional regulator [bacterium]
MNRLEAMAVFVAAAESGSLSAAARQLSMPLPTVSRKVSELESHLAARLFVRSTRKLALSEAGEAYLGACKRILEEVGNAERAAAGEYRAPRGELTVTAPVVFGRLILLPIVTAFLQAYPEVDLQLVLGDRNLNLADDHVDVALRIGALPDSSLRATQLGEVRTVVCASPEHFRRHGGLATPDDLASHPCVNFSGLKNAGRWNFSAGKKNYSIAVRPRLQVNTAEAAIDAAIAGLGVTRVLGYQIASACAAGTLSIALQDFEPPPLPVSLVFMGQGPLPLKLRAFLDFAAPRLKERLQQGST